MGVSDAECYATRGRLLGSQAGSRCSGGQSSDGLDLDKGALRAEVRDDGDGNRRRRVLGAPDLEKGGDSGVDVVAAGGEDRPFGDVGERATGALDGGAYVLERPLGLRGGIGTDQLTGLVDPVLAAHEEQASTGGNLYRLGELRAGEQPFGVVMNDHGTSYTGAVLERQQLAPAERRRFQTGRPCLDLTHTGGYGEYARWEILHNADDVARYLGLLLGIEPPETTAADVTPAKGLRDAVTRLARDYVAGRAQPVDAIEKVNHFAAAPPLVSVLRPDGIVSHAPATASQALSSLARDAIDLFGSPLVDRIRICEGKMCELLFVDTSRPGKRRWCSMEWCGDHEKKRTAGRPVRRSNDTG